jgi:hypothetical protein
MRRERAAPRDVQVPGQPRDPAQDLERLDIKIGPLAPPGRYQVIDLVPQPGIGTGPLVGMLLVRE